MIRTVSFDVGSTLLYPSPSVPEAFKGASGRCGYDFSNEQLLEAFPAVDGFYERRYLQDGDFWCTPDGCTQLWMDYYGEYCRLMGIEEGREAIVSEMLETYCSGRGWALYDDVIPAFELLKASGIRIAVISNWGVELPMILQDVGLAPYCELVSASSMLGCRKPSVEIFAMTYEAMGLDPSQALHVGDLPEADGEGAIKAGAKPLIIDRHARIQGCAFAVIDDLRRIVDYLD